MGRRRTGSVNVRYGRLRIRITLWREPKDARGEHPRHEFDAPAQPNGKPATRASAKATAQVLQHDYDEGRWTPAGRAPVVPAPAQTVLAWVTAWLAKQSYSEAERDRRRVALWLPRTAFGALPLADVTPRAAASLVGELRAAQTAYRARAAAPTIKPLAPRTVRNIVDPIARALRAAVFDGALAADPFAVLPTEHRPSSADEDPGARAGYRLTRTQVEALLGDDGCEDRWSVLWHLMLLSGARVSEAIALRWSDLQPETPPLLRRVRIAWQIHHRTRERVRTKTGQSRSVPEHPLLARVLAWWHRIGWAREYGRAPGADDLIVPARGAPGRPRGGAPGVGGPLWQQDVWRALQRDLTGAGVGHHRVHDFRHTMASLCVDAGMAEGVAARWTHTERIAVGARGLYVEPSWERQCDEMRRLRLDPPNGARWNIGVGSGVAESENPRNLNGSEGFQSARRGT